MKPNLGTYVLALLLVMITPCVFSQNAFITNRNGSSVSVINTHTNTVISTIPVHDHPSGVVVSADGTRAYIGYYTTASNYVTVINTTNNTVIGDIPVPGAASFGGVIDINPDGQTLYSASLDTVYAISTSTLAITGSVALGKGNSIQGITVTTDGTTIYANGYQQLYVINAKTLTKTDSISVPGANFYQLAVNADNTKVYGADKLSGGLHIVNLKTKKDTRLLFSTTVTDCVCVSLDGTRVYASNYTDSSICVVDGVSDTLIKRIKVNGGAPLGISITPDGKHVYEANFYSNNVDAINTETFAIEATVKVGKNPAAVGKFIISSSLILPVSLLHFGASLANQGVLLQWQTATESNTSYFTVERSVDGVNFSAIGKVAAAGSSNSLRNYQYNDLNVANLLGTKSVYYRLVTVNKDSSTATSAVAPVALTAKKIMMLLLPNPVTDKLTIRIGNADGKASIMIADMTGRIWYDASKMINSGKDVTINTSSLPRGIYTLQVKGTTTAQQRFIKQ